MQVYCDALFSNVATKKSCCSVAYRSALVARILSRQATPKPRCNILVLHWACCTTLDTDILPNHCRVHQAAMRTSTIPWSECAMIGWSRAMVTPSQIVVTAATAVAHTASIMSQQSRPPPAIGISCYPIHPQVPTWQAHIRTQTHHVARSRDLTKHAVVPALRDRA